MILIMVNTIIIIVVFIVIVVVIIKNRQFFKNRSYPDVAATNKGSLTQALRMSGRRRKHLLSLVTSDIVHSSSRPIFVL